MRIFLLTLLYSIALMATPSHATTLTEKEFTIQFAQELAQTRKDLKIQISKALLVTAKEVDGADFGYFLTNAYATYLANPSELKQIIKITIEANTTAKYKPEQKSILAVLKPASYLETIKQQLSQIKFGEKIPSLAYEKLTDDLYIFFVFDSENGIRMITEDDLTKLDINSSNLRDIAVKNLLSHFNKENVKLHMLSVNASSKIYRASVDSIYDASIMLLSAYWNKNIFDVQGEIVTYVPARNLVLVTGSEDKEGMKLASNLAKDGFNDLNYSISPKGFIFQNGSWAPLNP